MSFIALPLMVSIAALTSARADTLQTNVTADAGVSYYWRASHPAKLFKCWGKPDEAGSWQESGSESSTSNEGQLAPSFQGHGRDGFGAYVPQNLTWKAELSPERDLTVEFRQNVNESQTSYIHHECNTQRFVSKLDRVSNKLQSHARLRVPDDVWLLRVRKTIDVSHGRAVQDLQTEISGVDGIEEGASSWSDKTPRALRLSVGDSEYLMVEPGTDVDLGVKWNSQEPHSLDFAVKYEIRMMGVDECRRQWGSPEEFGASVNSIIDERLSMEGARRDPHGFIERVSCLRNADYLKSLLYRNHGRDLVRAFDRLNSRLVEWQRTDDATSTFDALTFATEIALFDAARVLMKDLLAYCDVQTIERLFGRTALSPAPRVRGYQVMARAMARVKYLLDEVPLALSASYVDLVERLAADGTTYAAAAARPASRRVLQELQTTLLDDEFMVFDPIREVLNSLRPVKSGRSERLEAEAGASAAPDAARAFQEQLRSSFQKFGLQSPLVVDASALRASFETLRAAHARIQRGLERDIDWFLGADGDVVYPPFTRDLMILNHDLLKVAGENLRLAQGEKRGGRFADRFLRPAEARTLYDQAVQCLRNSHEP